MKKVCICGGGNLGHVVAGFLTAHQKAEVSIFTRHPDRWSPQLTIHTPEGTTLKGSLSHISDDPAKAIAGADMVLLCLPGYAIAPTLRQLAGTLDRNTWVGSVVSSTGFFFEAMRLLPEGTPLFGFLRVPFIARTDHYGHEARLLGYKSLLNLAVEGQVDKEMVRATVEELFCTPTALLNNYLEASLSNSNPLLHPARLYDLWHGKETVVSPKPILFYEEWTLHASELYISMDKELQKLLTHLPVTPGCIPSVLDYYESVDASSLTRKLHSIKAFQGIMAPMKKQEDGWVADYGSRYFTEDFPYGLSIIRRLAEEHHVNTPVIKQIDEWGIHIMKTHHQGT